jgi:hypothetical protein
MYNQAISSTDTRAPNVAMSPLQALDRLALVSPGTNRPIVDDNHPSHDIPSHDLRRPSIEVVWFGC